MIDPDELRHVVELSTEEAEILAVILSKIDIDTEKDSPLQQSVRSLRVALSTAGIDIISLKTCGADSLIGNLLI
jgi:K+/H+ antiporter YhaU regulatory subunit KhtT